MLMHGMFAILVEDIRSGGNLSSWEAIERANELLLPATEQRALQNRRQFAHLLPAGKK